MTVANKELIRTATPQELTEVKRRKGLSPYALFEEAEVLLMIRAEIEETRERLLKPLAFWRCKIFTCFLDDYYSNEKGLRAERERLEKEVNDFRRQYLTSHVVWLQSSMTTSDNSCIRVLKTRLTAIVEYQRGDE